MQQRSSRLPNASVWKGKVKVVAEPTVLHIVAVLDTHFFKNQVFCGFNRFVHFGDDQKVKIETNIDGLDDLPDLT